MYMYATSDGGPPPRHHSCCPLGLSVAQQRSTIIITKNDNFIAERRRALFVKKNISP